MKRRRNAFTLLEIMAVVAVILILLSIAVIGLKGTAGSTEIEQTRKLLESLNSMFNEYKVKGGDLAVLDSIAVGGVQAPTDIATMTSVRNGAAVQNTRIVMSVLARDPNVKKILDSMPPERVSYENVSGRPCPIILDAWGNPIIYVPGGPLNNTTTGGLRGVNKGALGTPGSGSVSWTFANQTVQAPANKPFFASAGPDMRFSYGDDNVYSFKE